MFLLFNIPINEYIRIKMWCILTNVYNALSNAYSYHESDHLDRISIPQKTRSNISHRNHSRLLHKWPHWTRFVSYYLYKQNVFVAYLNSVSVFFIAKSLGLTVFTFSRRKKNICIYYLFGIIGASTNFYLICNRFLFHKFNYNMMSNQYICFICCSHFSFIGSFVVQLITVP